MTRTNLFLALALTIAPAWADEALNLTGLDRLAAKAEESVNLNFDMGLLKMASGMFGGDTGSAELKKLVAGLQNMTIRSFEFKNPGEYTQADVDSIRAQLKSPEWKRVVEVRSKKEGDSDIYVRVVDGHSTGLTIIAAEPKELTIVSIEGPIDAEGWKKLRGNLGLPGMTGKKPRDDKKDEE